MAYFSAFELCAYLRARWTPNDAVLDLGCREGTFAEMLKLCTGFEAQFTGADIDPVNLSQAAQRQGIYKSVVRLDASHIAFRDATFDSVISNAVFYCLRPDPIQATREVFRVLKDGGTFACTVPTHTANQHYLITECLKRRGLSSLGSWYQRRVDKRMGHVSMLTPEEWERIICEAGLIVQNIIPYMSAAISRRWSMYLEIPRVLSVLKFFESGRIRSVCAAVLQRHMARSYQRQSILPREEQGDYLLIISKKPARL